MRPIAILALAAALAGGPALAQPSGDDSAERPRQPGQGLMRGGGPGMTQGQGMMQGRGMRGDRAGRHGMQRHGMQRHGMMQGGVMQGGGAGRQIMMKTVFALMDADGSGALSLQEARDAQARLFAHADANGDGELTRAEMRGFLRPARPARRGRAAQE